MYSTCFRCDRNILVSLSLPYEVNVEVSVVLECNYLRLLFIYEEISKFELVRFCLLNGQSSNVSKYGVMYLVTLSLYIKDERSSLPLYITDEIVVIVKFESWLEQNLNGNS